MAASHYIYTVYVLPVALQLKYIYDMIIIKLKRFEGNEWASIDRACMHVYVYIYMHDHASV